MAIERGERRTGASGWPLWAVFLVTSLTFGGLMFLTFAFLIHARDPGLLAVIMLPAGLFFGAGMSAFVLYQRRRNGGMQGTVDLTRALKTGKLPHDANPWVWTARLQRSERSYRRMRWIFPIEFGFFAVVSILLAFGSRFGEPWFFLVLAAAHLALAIWGTIITMRSLRRIRSMLAQLGGPATD